MNIKSDNIQLKGTLLIEKYSYENKLIEKIEVPNLVVTTGKTYVASRMIGTSPAVMSHMAIGGNSTTPLVGDIGLLNELGRVGTVPGTFSFSATGNVVTYTATFGPGVGTGSIVEAGIFNAGTGGTMLCRTTFPVISKDNPEAIVITWNISVG